MGERFTGKEAVVTGNDSGLGFESTFRLESEGEFARISGRREHYPSVSASQ